MAKLEWAEFDEEDGFEIERQGKLPQKRWNVGIFPSIILLILFFFSVIVIAALADFLKIF